MDLLPITLTELGFLILFLFYIIFSYAARDVPLYVKFLIVGAWLLSFGLIIVLPLDVFDTLQKDTGQVNSVWTGLYWTNFILTWTALPIAQEYENAGEFTFEKKMWKSIKVNLIMYGIGAAVGLIFLVIFFIKSQPSFSSVLATCVVLSNGFGLMLIVILLGYGLVAIPKDYFRSRDTIVRANKLYQSISQAHSNSKTYTIDLEDLAQNIYSVQNKYRKNETFQEYFNLILCRIPDDILERAKHNPAREDLDPNDSITEAKLAEWHQNVKLMVHQLDRNQQQLDKQLNQVMFLEDVIECEDQYPIRSRIRHPRTYCCGQMIDWLSWIWNCKLRQYIQVVLAVFFGGLSILVVLSQISIFSGVSQLNAFGSMFNKEEGFLLVEILCWIPLCYILYCILFGLLQIRVTGYFAFYQQHTDTNSLFFSATFISRISFPLAFNFLWIVNVDDTPVSNVVGNFNLDSNVVGFKLVLPILLIILVIFNIFEVYDKFLGALGVTRFQFHRDYSDELIEDGKIQVQYYRRRLEQEQPVEEKLITPLIN